MEILIFLLVIALLATLILGPIAFFKAFATGNKLGRLERHVEYLSAQLHETQEICQQLRDAQPDSTTPREKWQTATPSDPNSGSQASVDTPHVPTQSPPADEQPTDLPNTLERLRKLRQQQQAEEQANETAPPPPKSPKPDLAPTASLTPTEAQAPQETAEPAAPEPANATSPAIPSTDKPTATQDNVSTPAPRRLTLEEVLAGKVFVWIGAVALVLTAAFLLKLGFDRNIITEPVRVIGAAVFGIALWCVGEWARGRVGLIAQALCGAAVAVLYASVLAGHNLYALFGPNGEAIAFTLMATITAAAILLSLRHGPAVAILGMLGGFMLPPVLNQDFGPSTGMILYLLAIEVGVLAVTGKRGWFGISAMTLLFTIIWSLGYTLVGDNPLDRTLTALLVLGTASAYLVHTARIHSDPDATSSTRKRVLGLSIAATCSAIGVVALLAVRGDYLPRDLGMLGLVAAGTLILARIDARQLAMPFVAMGLSLLVLFSGAMRSLPAAPSQTLITMCACFGGLFVLGGYISLWASPHRRVFAVMTAIAGPAFYGIVIVAGYEAFGLRDAWWPYTLGLAGLYALAAAPLFLRRKAEHDWLIALFSVLSFALICVTLMQSMNHPRLAVCLALVSAAAALIDLRLFIRPLRLAACIVAFIAAGLLVVPGPFDMTIHGSAVLNNLLPMYILPALAFGVIAWSANRAGSQTTATNLTTLCCGTLGVMLIALTRDAFHPLDFNHEGFALYEWATLACVLMLAAMLGQVIANRLNLDAVGRCVVVCAGLGGAVAVIGGFVPGNPLFHREAEAGGQLALGLLGLTLAPAALMWLWSRRALVANHGQLPAALRVGSIALTALFVALQLRNVFHLDDLHAFSIMHYECAAYGLAWVLLGTLFNFISPLCTLSQATQRTGRVVFGLGLATLVIGNALILNPFWHGSDPVGNIPVFNGLWILFGPTILILALLARKARRLQHQNQAKLAGFAAIGLSFMLLSMLVRHGFSGDGFALIASNLASSERYAYSLAWVLFGGVLLVAGVFTRLDTLRYGSLAILLLAVGKVFLIDSANLQDLYRVMSYFGLGVTLIGLGYLYQRLVFKRDSNPSGASPE